MRNVLVHDYFRINEEVVWATVEKDIPALKEKLEEILRQTAFLPAKVCAICRVRGPTFHLTQHLRGKIEGKIIIRKIDLCEDCARQHGLDSDPVTPLPESIWALATPEYIDDHG